MRDNNSTVEYVRNRLKSRAGESLAEVLISVLISALGIAMLAGVISSAADVVARSKDTMDSYITAGNQLAARSDDTAEGTGTVKLQDDSNNTVKISDDSDSSITVNYYINDTAAGDPVVSYSRESNSDEILDP